MTEGERQSKLVALAKANQVRCARAALKRDIAAGRCSIAAALASPPAGAEGITLGELLTAVPLMGRRRVDRLLSELAVSERRRLDQLTPRQRAQVLREFGRLFPGTLRPHLSKAGTS